MSDWVLLAAHGAGSWDEIAIAVAAFVVLWVAVKLAGRKPAEDDEAVDEQTLPAEAREERVEQPAVTREERY